VKQRAKSKDPVPGVSPVVTTHEIAKMFQCDPSSVAKWIDRGLLIAYRTPGGHRRVRMSDLLDFARRQEMPIFAEEDAH
jgi:excisionase family DNA binding protein